MEAHQIHARHPSCNSLGAQQSGNSSDYAKVRIVLKNIAHLK
jgi:hypothetical protein